MAGDASSPVRLIKSMAEFDELMSLSKDKLVAVDFFATWCGPCKVIGPKFKAMAGEDTFKDKVIFCSCDVDTADDVAARCKIEAMPTFIFFKNGKQVDQLVGADEKRLREMLTKNS